MSSDKAIEHIIGRIILVDINGGEVSGIGYRKGGRDILLRCIDNQIYYGQACWLRSTISAAGFRLYWGDKRFDYTFPGGTYGSENASFEVRFGDSPEYIDILRSPEYMDAYNKVNRLDHELSKSAFKLSWQWMFQCKQNNATKPKKGY